MLKNLLCIIELILTFHNLLARYIFVITLFSAVHISML